MLKIKHIISISAVSLMISSSGYAAYEEVIPKDAAYSAQWSFRQANACLIADNIHRVNANGECLAIQTYFYKNELPLSHPKLIIFIHGDGMPGGSASDYLKYQATKFNSPNIVSVVLIRPGYYDSYGNYSTGESYAFACHGYACDGYRENTVATIAAAISELKTTYHPKCTILVGHSGGAIMSGIILGKYPNLVNGGVLASVTYNVLEFSKRHTGWGEWTQSLSPDSFVKNIPKKNFVYIISGNKDDVTFPDLAKKYYSALQDAKIKSAFINVPNGTHDSIVTSNTTALDQTINTALQDCDK